MRLLFFAQCADWMHCREMAVSIEGSVVLSEVLQRPEFAPLKKRTRSLKVAVNQEYADFHAQVRDGDEVAIFPPVCGG